MLYDPPVLIGTHSHPPMPRPKPKRTAKQRRHMRDLRRWKTYKALGVAYLYMPVLRWCLVNGMSHRQMCDFFNERRYRTPAYVGRRGRFPAGKRWTVAQMQRLLKRAEELIRKMRWARFHAKRRSTALAKDARSAQDYFDSLMLDRHAEVMRLWQTRSSPLPHRAPAMSGPLRDWKGAHAFRPAVKGWRDFKETRWEDLDPLTVEEGIRKGRIVVRLMTPQERREKANQNRQAGYQRHRREQRRDWHKDKPTSPIPKTPPEIDPP